MQRALAREVGDLMPAGRPARHEHGIRGQAARGRQQPALADGPGDVEVLARVAERSGHAAAAGIGIDDRRAGNAGEERLRGRKRAHRLLMAVAVHD